MQTRKPKSQLPRQGALECDRVIGVRKQRLGYKEGVFGVVTAHPVAENETLPPYSVPPAFNTAAGQPLRRQPKRVTDSSPEQ
jgi:hypothetical protein